MFVNWGLYEMLLGNGGSPDLRSVTMANSVNAFISSIVNDPAYQADTTIEGVITPLAVAPKSTISCSVKAIPETNIHIGDIVDCFGKKWVVVELYTDQVGFINGTIWLCNDIIRFQNSTSEIYEALCVIDDGTYSKRSSDSDAYVMTNTYHIYMPVNDATRRLYVDKRLALGQIFSSIGEEILEVYKIVGIDLKSKNFGDGSHLMMLTMQRDVYNPQADNLLENICDYIADSGDTGTASTGSCNIVGRDSIRLGASRTYTAQFLDEGGVDAGDVVAEWSVSAPDGVLYEIDGSNLKVTVPLSEGLVGEIIVLILTDAGGVYGTCEKKVQVTAVG